MQQVPWLELRGSPENRCAHALNAVDQALADAWRFTPPLEQQTAWRQ
ncbi:MAG: hypothetical protein LBU46_00275 [Candidatus Accumulibacter sp.]|nr:hypothetical protein [Accumulibacter sp.]